MCLNPIELYNPSKYINLKHGDQFKLVVPCGKCADCMDAKRDEWHFRMNAEFSSHLSTKGNYVLFETLTYRDDSLPHVSDFCDIGISADYPCFNRHHIRYFLLRLRRMLDYRGYGHIRYFLTSEYGSKYHRPHYHILVFAPSDLDPLLLCRFIHQSWSHGLTDWSNNGDSYILKKRIFNDYSLHGMRMANYVAKYVQKDSEFDSEIKNRIDLYLNNSFRVSDLSSMAEQHSMRIKLANCMCQFHLQSKGFGLQYLNSQDFNLDEIFETGMIKYLVPDKMDLYKHIPLPQYYYRHLFQNQIEVDGKRLFELNALGIRYKLASEVRKRKNLVTRFNSWLMNLGSLPSEISNYVYRTFENIDIPSLAEYVLFMRYRFKSHLDYASLSSKLEDIDFYHYSTVNDVIIYGKPFVTSSFLGNDLIGYDPLPEVVYDRRVFSETYTYIDSIMEHAYQVYLYVCRFQCHPNQSVYDLKMKLENLYKYMFQRL